MQTIGLRLNIYNYDKGYSINNQLQNCRNIEAKFTAEIEKIRPIKAVFQKIFDNGHCIAVKLLP